VRFLEGEKDPVGAFRRRTKEWHKALRDVDKVTARKYIYINQQGDVRHMPPENAMSTLNALVLFSTLASDLSALRMPIMTRIMATSPAELMTNDILETRLRAMDSN
jgi:hypothetical protein